MHILLQALPEDSKMTNDGGKDPKELLMAAIGPEIARIEQYMRLDLSQATSATDPLLRSVLEYGILNGGKRIRPLLVILAARLCGLEPIEERTDDIYKLAIAFEYLHGATLYHDDVIDRADMRRGKASVNHKFGIVAAILGGDFLHSRSMFLVGSLGGAEALEIFCRATNGMVDGEFLQLRNAQNYNVSESDYFEAVKGKTALLIGATCEIGALSVGASPAEQRALADYGISLGTAFQIIDDLLDYQGESTETGKAVGNDFHEGKMTLPLILALKGASLEDGKRLRFLLEDEPARSQVLDEVYGLIAKYDGFTKSRDRAEAIVAKALSGLEIFMAGDSSNSLGIFYALTRYVLERKK